jgi:FlaA1/EpsC-like NDP-sugar epimerase
MYLLKNKRKIVLLGIDACILFAVYALSLLVSVFATVGNSLMLTMPGYAIDFVVFAICIYLARSLMHSYSNVWRYANSLVFLKLILADAIGGMTAVIITHFIDYIDIGVWMGCAFVAMSNIVTLASRFIYQLYYKSRSSSEVTTNKTKIPVAILGAGKVGNLLAEELVFDKSSKYRPVCFIDNDKRKIGGKVLELPIFAQSDELDKIKKLKAEEIFIAVPKLSEERTKALIEYYTRNGFAVKIYDFPIKSDGSSDETSKRVVRDIRIEDLLFRDMLKIIDSESKEYYKNKVVLVTGGGGSIGSELCRQIAKCQPKKLVIFDIYENNAYEIQQELCRTYGDSLDLAVEIGSVRDRERLEAVFCVHRPQVVFHAAAHKHVPLMETVPEEAVKNNIFGTFNVATLSELYNVDKFVMISTDKAVNPTNVMGATKRACEMIIQARAQKSKHTEFVTTRFGNVLGSNGSVIPLFRRQIESGSAVTVTHPDIIRYFMTIPEAVSLVLEAGAMAKGGEIFVLDMGAPVKITTLAENLIRMYGKVPYKDVPIVFTGLRPGEKLFEELLMDEEGLKSTENKKIFIGNQINVDSEVLRHKLEGIRVAADSNDSEKTVELLSDLVPTFNHKE